MFTRRVSLPDPSHEDLFIQHYERLLARALHLTEGDHARAHDLVQDAFVQFTFQRRDLSSIENVEAYLGGIVRHLHLSQIRRVARSSQGASSVIDFEAAEIVLQSADLRTQTQIQDELRAVCRYACVRKDSSKAGCVLILRFFHGYYPSEAARILRTPRQVVDNWLRLARREARSYLDDPGSLVFMTADTQPAQSNPPPKQTPSDLFQELRQMIFGSRKGSCPSRDQLHELYQSDEPGALETPALAHIVSCERCLAEVNRLLGLPPLSDRHPPDMLGPDAGGRGDLRGDTKRGMKMNAIETNKYLRAGQRRTRMIYEHRPEALEFTVNGYLLSTCVVDAESNEQTFTVNIDEKISFVEVFGDQGIRLALLEVEPPPDGPATNTQKIDLSDGRSLQLSLNFSNPWPSLHTLYRDPLLKSEAAAPEVESRKHEDLETSALPQVGRASLKPTNHLRSVFRLLPAGFWLRPATVTTLVALMLVSAFLLMRWRAPTPVTAASLLQQSASAEEAIAGDRTRVAHRVIDLEERNANGELLARNKVEIWHSAEKGITVRRRYDERGLVIDGAWTRAGDVTTLYHHGARPRIQLRNPETAIRSFNDVWQLEPSAKEFGQLIKNTQNAQVEERANSYVISAASGNSLVLENAQLVLTRDGLHAIAQTLTVRQGNETRQYKFTETAFEQKALTAVAPAMFEAEPELLSEAKPNALNPAWDSKTPEDGPRLAPPIAASSALEVEVLRLLNQAGADTGEQVSLTRTPSGQLRVEGIIDTAARKAELLRALSPVANNPSLIIDISTIAEALERQKRNRREPSTPSATPESEIESVGDTFPAYSDLRKHFSDEEARRFASQIVNRSDAALRHAGALKQLGDKFSAEAIEALDPEAQNKFIALIQSHARAFENEDATLRRQLQLTFPDLASGDSEPPGRITSAAQLLAAIRSLFDLSVANDHAVRAAFSVTTGTTSRTINSAQLYRSLVNAEKLAAEIQNTKLK